MKPQTKYPAPALARGLQVLDLLARHGTMTLEALAQASEIPKASLLRLLETLVALDFVARDRDTREYAALVRIIPARRLASRFRAELRQRLRELAERTGCTVEWYEPDADSVVLSDRAEPACSDVYLQARVGFRRHLNGELEAVARVALAAGLPAPQSPAYWQYDKQGRRQVLSGRRVAALLRQARQDLLTMDRGWNLNGVRRYAAGIRLGEELAGILALAETFKPGVDRRIDENLEVLSATANELQARINKRS